MKLCETEIVTYKEGRRSRFCARGTLSSEEGASVVRYFDGGDAVALTVREGSLAMERAGMLAARFEPGVRTEMTFFEGDRRGAAAVETETLRVRFMRNGLHALLRYRLLFSAGEEKFTLKISVAIISEEE